MVSMDTSSTSLGDEYQKIECAVLYWHKTSGYIYDPVSDGERQREREREREREQEGGKENFQQDEIQLYLSLLLYNPFR